MWQANSLIDQVQTSLLQVINHFHSFTQLSFTFLPDAVPNKSSFFTNQSQIPFPSLLLRFYSFLLNQNPIQLPFFLLDQSLIPSPFPPHPKGGGVNLEQNPVKKAQDPVIQLLQNPVIFLKGHILMLYSPLISHHFKHLILCS